MVYVRNGIYYAGICAAVCFAALAVTAAHAQISGSPAPPHGGSVGSVTAAVPPPLTALSVSAQTGGAGTPKPDTVFDNPIQYGSFAELLLAVLNGVTLILLPFIALGIVFIGFRMVVAGASKPEEFAKLKYSFIGALVGLFLVLGANGIIRVIQNTVRPILADDPAVTAVTGTVLPAVTALSVSAQSSPRAESPAAVLPPVYVSAQTAPASQGEVPTVEGLSLAGLVDTAIQIVGGVLIPLAIALLFLVFVISIVRYLHAAGSGEKEMHKAAVKRLLIPVFILFCVFMLWGLVEIIRLFFGG